jgi:hypothetical protein
LNFHVSKNTQSSRALRANVVNSAAYVAKSGQSSKTATGCRSF